MGDALSCYLPYSMFSARTGLVGVPEGVHHGVDDAMHALLVSDVGERVDEEREVQEVALRTQLLCSVSS